MPSAVYHGAGVVVLCRSDTGSSPINVSITIS
jgi:hypothetical protein